MPNGPCERTQPAPAAIAPDEDIHAALRRMAKHLEEARGALLAANDRDVEVPAREAVPV
ncbi:hypothetical protein [Streptomyces sp. NBC_00258]|uniref:hypothetical protein n=1 Tax=Streptomyces sp. NBC_00258 TaxID=2903642 RepID=UPI002E2CA149|nr:hypothetical protein [Streptomyces sp. NBC_00258]